MLDRPVYLPSGAWRKTLFLAALLVSASLLAACKASVPEHLTVEVLAQHPHDAEAFTQGLLIHDGLLYESTGLEGRSSLREVEPKSGEGLRRRDLDTSLFAEGLAQVDDRLIQLTWQAGIAFVWDRATFNPLGQFSYGGEGWGLCFDGEGLYMSDGSATLTRRDAADFSVTGTVKVQAAGQPLDQLNELECVGDSIYANVWLSDEIVRIDKASGRVTARIDAAPLRALMPGLKDPNAVLNGVAYDADADIFWLTGKLWPSMFEVRFVPQDR